MDGVVTYDEVARFLRPEIVDEIEATLGWRLDHGTFAGYQREVRTGRQPCPRCLEATRRVHKERRRS